MQLGSVGNEIEKVLQKGGIRLATRRLVGMKVLRVPPDKISVPAIENNRGYLLIGQRQGDQLDVQRVRVNRWIFHPISVRMPPIGTEAATGNGIERSPSMVTSHRVWVECETQGCCSKAMWIDDVRRMSKHLLESKLDEAKEADESVRNGIIHAYQGKFMCKDCGKLAQITRNMTNGRLFSTHEDQTVDPVYTSADDPDIAAFQAASEGHDTLYLPRIWAVYKKDKAPMDWAPQDPVAEELERRVQQHGKMIRPLQLAAQVVNQRGALLTFLMDVPKGGKLAEDG